jgi:ketosteroid isomerase-like protein
MVNGFLVAIPVRSTGTHAGAHVDMAGADVLTVRDDRIAEEHLFSGDGNARDA